MSLFGDELGGDDVLADGSAEYAPATSELCEPKSMTFCLGHEDIEKQFIELYQKNSMPHGMIFAGPQGVGKTTMAFRLARFLLKHGKGADDQDSLFGGGDDIPQDIDSMDVAADDPVFARVASGGHADLLHIARHYDSTKGKQDASLKVEALRQIEPFLRKTASEGGWRVVIVEDADTMNRSAQNAILKILEEPPANVLIILVAHRPGMLIQTIRSRSRVISFPALSKDDIEILLRKGGVYLPPQDLDTIHALSEGSVGAALNLVEQDALSTLQTIEALLEGGQGSKIHEQANSMASPSQDKEYMLFSFLMQWLCRQMLFVKARGLEVPPYLGAPCFKSKLETLPLEKLIALSDDMRAHFNRTEFSNLDRRDAIRGAFHMLQSARI